MNEPAHSKISRLSELPQAIAPPRDLWPALEARLSESAMPRSDSCPRQHDQAALAARGRARMRRVAALAAVVAAVAVGISIDRWILPPAPATRPVAEITTAGAAHGQLAVRYITDPRFLRARVALQRSLDARLAALPPPTRKKVLESLAVIRRSMRQVRRALGRQPGNALLQGLLIDTYQDEIQMLSTVQDTSGGAEVGA